MSNFLSFIEEDIEAKKNLFSTMPTKTKKNKKDFNDKITSISKKYEEYKSSVKKYIVTKSKSFSVKLPEKKLDDLKKTISNLEYIRFILNPTNGFFEKLELGNLLYQISNYYDFNFGSLNDIINQFLEKFEMAGINLNSDDFNYTFYVHEYMSSFFEVRNSKKDGYEKISEIFEKIYWLNPDIIAHIELNFRKLIRKNEKKFDNYIEKLQKEVKIQNKIINYEDCLQKIKDAYAELDILNKENIADIINLAKNGNIDMTKYFEDNKYRLTTYSDFMIDSINLQDKTIMDRFYESLEKLKVNIEEYSKYIKFVPLFNDFKSEYEKHIPKDEKGLSGFRLHMAEITKKVKSIESQISNKEAKLEKLNKKVFKGEIGFFESKDSNLKQQRTESIRLAKELYDLYKEYENNRFNTKILAILSSSLTISELLHLYYSFDYFKKMAIKRAFNITSYDDIIKYSEDLDSFAINPTNIIINGIPVFEEGNIDKIIINKYRLDNINLTEESLNPDDLDTLLDKIQFLLRINEIEKSTTTVEKIWFMAQVEKINRNENKSN